LEVVAMLPHRFVRPLTAAESRRIEELFRRAPQPRVRRRANAVRLSALGYTVREIAEVIGCTRQTVRNCFDHFESGGADALHDKPRSGRPPVATPDYRARLVEVVKTSPSELGYPFTVWSVARLRAHMAREMDVLVSGTRVRQIMKEEGLVFKRPKHTLKGKRDEDAFAAVRDLLDRLKESPWNPIPA
jgi:transposase